MAGTSSTWVEKRYNPLDEKDAAEILKIFENWSDVEDLSDDALGEEENDFSPSADAGNVRVGADKIGPNSTQFAEVSETHWDDEDDIPLSLFAGPSAGVRLFYADIVTPKERIEWSKRKIQNVDITTWNDTVDADVNSDILSPLYYFQKYLGDSEFQKIADFTNMYALQKSNNFKPTNAAEIKSLFGLHIAVGSLKFRKVRLFWDQTLCINLFRETMSRDRFFQLRTNLHCVNNLEIPENCNDKLYKVRPLYDAIRKRCHELHLEENLCIDEQIVPFSGHLSIKQYIKGKPTPWGVKIFVLCGRSGIAYDFLIYQGASSGLNIDTLRTFGLGASVVLHLCDRIKGEGHKLFFDNYFSSYQLLQILKSKKIYSAGTVRINRFSKPPLLDDKELKNKGRGSHDEVTSKDGDVVLVKWMDNRAVFLASNFVGVGNEDMVSRWDKSSKSYIQVTRPEVVKLYNHSMGGVDLLDQMIGTYRIYIRSRKWTLRLIFHAVDLAIANSWFEYKKDCKKLNIPRKDQLGLLDFRLRLAECLVKVGKTVGVKRGRPIGTAEEPKKKKLKQNEEKCPHSEIRYDSVDHLPQLDGSREGKRCKNGKCNKKKHFFCHVIFIFVSKKKETVSLLITEINFLYDVSICMFCA